MNTLIELYDERAIENILAPDMFRPRRIVYLCPGEIAQNRTQQETLAAFFRRRGWEPELIFVETSLFKADRILRQLFTIGERFPDCAIDVTGGSDAALFAAGMFAAKEGVPAFTYSRKKNRFYDISGAAFADELPCGLTYSIEDFFLMAGGTLLPGRVDNHILAQYLPDFDRFFQCFLRFRREWPDIISYIQRVSPSEYGQTPPLSVQGGYTVKGERGTRNTVNEAALRELARIDLIRELDIIPDRQVSFRFRDLHTRAWLRDVGSVLELYTYRIGLKTMDYSFATAISIIQSLVSVALLLGAPCARAEYRELREGMRGSDVLALKTAMYYLGYFTSLNLSDSYNAVMTQRVKNLQKANALPQTGRADAALQALVFSGQCVPAPGASPEGAHASRSTVTRRRHALFRQSRQVFTAMRVSHVRSFASPRKPSSPRHAFTKVS